jgi:hypothetical protein
MMLQINRGVFELLEQRERFLEFDMWNYKEHGFDKGDWCSRNVLGLSEFT